MSLPLNAFLHMLHLILLRTASLLVPVYQRADWMLEWRTELHYVCESLIFLDKFSWHIQHEILAFCLGSFQDAMCLRRQAWEADTKVVRVHNSAMQCLLCLSTVLALCAILSRLLPGIQAEYDTVRHPLRSNLILIQGADSNNNGSAAVSFVQFQDWKANRQRFFDGLAFYHIATEMVSISDERSARLKVAVASPNAISLLGLPVKIADRTSNELMEDAQAAPQVILSYETWTHSFGSNPHIAGRFLKIGRQFARIAGVLPCGSWSMPTNPDLWLLTPNSRIASTVRKSPGYVLAHLTPLGQDSMYSDTISITVRGASGNDPSIFGILCKDRSEGPWRIYLFAFALAVLALPAVTSVLMSESNFSSHHPSRKQNLNRWLFLVAKLVLISVIAYFASLDIAYWNSDAYSETAELIQFSADFSICLLGLRWALIDQGSRCPVCLRRVTHPARVGLVSQTFLGWNGTEMMCVGGHALLHVPSLPTSWFGAQRWLYLDTSWEFLFADLLS